MSGVDIKKADGKMLLSAFGIWILSAAVLLGISGLILYYAQAGERAIGYASSALSFTAAMLAGANAVNRRATGALLTGIITGVSIIIALLTVGFIAEGSKLSPDGIMNVVTFSLAGCLSGCVLFSGRTRKVNKKKKVNVKK